MPKANVAWRLFNNSKKGLAMQLLQPLLNSKISLVSHNLSVLSASVLVAIALTGCASTQGLPDAQRVQADSQITTPAAWQATLPHGGDIKAMTQWWTQWGDDLLGELLQAGQKESPTLAAARTRIAQARAALTGAQAASLPNVNATAQASRGVQAPKAPVADSASIGLQAAWEIDVFGGNRAASSAAQTRLQSAELGWHEARVLVAIETASAYYDWLSCQTSLGLAQSDATSRAETARLAELTAKAGFSAPANSALARASAADASNTLRSAQAQCDVKVKALVALTGMPEPELRQKLEQNKAVAQKITAQAALFTIASLPAEVIAQRPDIAAAQRAVAAASADARAADARRLPVLSLNGSISGATLRQSGESTEGLTWSLGPIALTLPILDGGRNAANAQAAVAAYDEAVVTLRAKVRTAVREVEEALVNLDSTAQRSADVQTAASGYKASLDATQARYKAGLASLVELEDARRTALAAQQSQLALDRERIAAWVSLYRAAGGGWTGQGPTPVATQAKP
jgi:outer membrane protein, multidrug efflux system